MTSPPDDVARSLPTLTVMLDGRAGNSRPAGACTARGDPGIFVPAVQ